MLRTHTCGELRIKDVNKEVILCGWLHSIRWHGKLFFLDLRDRYGITQCVIKARNEKEIDYYKSLRKESVLRIKGKVQERIPGQKNKDMQTGEIEVSLSSLEVLSPSEPTPFKVEDDVIATEELRLKYRYLDIRRTPVKDALIKRYIMIKTIRDYLTNLDFIEVETPVLGKSTPEGARDFLVPSRLHKGKFYALPQSPQIYKQLCMIAGLDKYFQIAKCFRDEDLRKDRQPEFTQLDMEMSFVEEEDIYRIIEGMLKKIWKKILGIDIRIPFERLTYEEAMERYGSDKPDLRFGYELQEISAEKCGFKILEKTRHTKAIFLPNLNKKQIKILEETAKKNKAKGLIWLNKESPYLKHFNKEFLKIMKPKKTVIIIGDDNRDIVNEALGQVRLKAIEILNLKSDEFKFLWITDFPLFELNEEGEITSSHHPFTSPREQDIPKLEKEPLKVLSRAYDIVLNGSEIGGGSIRIHDRNLQNRIFRILGLTEDVIQRNFGFLTEAFKYGAPPHGGIALGIDRIAAILTGNKSLRDVIAFPKIKDGSGLMEGSPSEVFKEQLDELGIKIKN